MLATSNRVFLSKRSADSTKLIRSLQNDPLLRQTSTVTPQTLHVLTDHVSRNYNCSYTEAEDAVKHLIRQKEVRRSNILTNRVSQVQYNYRLIGDVGGREDLTWLVGLLSPNRNWSYSGWPNNITLHFNGDPQIDYSKLPGDLRLEEIGSYKRGQEQKSITIPATSTHPSRTVPVNDTPPPTAGPAKDLTIDADPTSTDEANPAEKAEDLTKPVADTASSRQQKLLNSIKALKIAIAEVAKDMFQTDLLEEKQDKVVTKCIDAISAAQSEQTADTVKTMASPLIGAQ